MQSWIFSLLFVFFAANAAEFESYEGYKVFQIQPENEEQVEILRKFEENPSVDFWAEPKKLGRPTVIMVDPLEQESISETLKQHQIPYNLLIENVESNLSEEHIRQKSATKTVNGRVSFEAYNRYDEIQEYLAQLALDYPQLVSLENIGTSYEDRNISMIKISSGGNNKPVILFEGGIHAREWISPAFVLYIIQQLVENENNRDVIENVDWYIVPVLNPDGYEHTHTNARLWRKTRSVSNLLCRGVDGNRNFDFHWMETGASSNTCSETYAGASAFSELETVAMRDTVLKYQDRIKLYVSFHSYGNYILYPWGYTSELPDNVEDLYSLAADVEGAIAAVSGTRYQIGSTTEVLYSAAGNSHDWIKGVAGVDMTYTFELPGGGLWGFDLPASRILEVSVETFEGVKVYHNYVEKNYA